MPPHQWPGRQLRPGPVQDRRQCHCARIIESILQPSKEIAPQFTVQVVATKAGLTHTGVVVAEDPRGELVLADAQGKLIRIKQADVEERSTLPTLIMPDNVHEQMTPAEFRDLIAFLSALK